MKCPYRSHHQRTCLGPTEAVLAPSAPGGRAVVTERGVGTWFAVAGSEAGGVWRIWELATNILGLYESKFQYVLEDYDWKAAGEMHGEMHARRREEAVRGATWKRLPIQSPSRTRYHIPPSPPSERMRKLTDPKGDLHT